MNRNEGYSGSWIVSSAEIFMGWQSLLWVVALSSLLLLHFIVVSVLIIPLSLQLYETNPQAVSNNRGSKR